MTSHGIRVNERTGQSLRQIHGFQIGATSYFHYNGLGGRLGFRQQSDLLMPDTALPAPQLMATLGTTKKSRLAVSFKQYFEKQNRAAKSSKDLQKAASSESDAVAFALGNPSSPGGPARWSYAWDVAGRLASVTYPRRDEGFATQATYQYQAGFLTSIDASFQDPFAPGFVGSVSASLAYDAPGWVRDTAVSTSARSGEVLHVTSARDGSGLPRPASWGVSHRDLDPNVSPLIALETRTYSYDPLGNVIGIASSRGFPVSYRYDTRSRLIQDEIAGRMVLTESREYDGFGNLVKVNNDALGTNKGTNRLLTRASYDSAGRMIEDEALNVGRDYYPDGALMAEFAHPEGSVETLAPNGASIWLMNGSAENVLSFWGDATYCQTEQFRSLVRDESAKLLTEYRGETEAPCVCDTPCVFRDRFYRDIVRLGPWATASYTRGVGIKLEALDHLGTPRYVTTASGTSPSFVLLDSFGAQISGTPATRELFTGHERNHTSDQAVSLPISDYMHARTYVPMLGRFTRPDPSTKFSLVNPQSLNRYSYVMNNPVKFVDPTGMTFILAGCGSGSTQTQCDYQRSLVLGALPAGARRYVQPGSGGRLVLKGIAANEFKKFGQVAHGLAYLISSPSQFTLRTGADEVTAKAGGSGFVYETREIHFDPAAYPSTKGPKGDPDFTISAVQGFVHELGHAVGSVIPGLADDFTARTGRTLMTLFVSKQEGYATNWENRFRLGRGDALRPYYKTPSDVILSEDPLFPGE